MALSLTTDTLTKSIFHFVSGKDNVSTQNNLSAHSQTAVQNTSFEDGCITVSFSQMEFLPWDNPDNLVSAEVETILRRIKNNLLVLLFLIGGPANVINMAVFYKQGLKDRVNLCLFALSLADEIHLVTAMFSYGEQMHIQFTTKERFGPTLTFLTNHNLLVFFGITFVSPVLSAIIATERCLCVLNPLKFQRLLRTRTMAAAIIAVNVFVFSLFFVVVYRFRIECVHDPESGVSEMTVIEGEFYKAHKELIDHLDSFVFGVGLPGVVMVVVVTTTVITIVKLRQIVTWRLTMSSSISSREVGLTKMLVANSLFFIVCMFPDAVNRFSWLLFPEINSGRRHHNFFLSSLWVTEVFVFTNSTFNIFLYYTMGSRYRATFWALLGRRLQSGKE